jgi:hypothetical protein
VCIDDVIHIWPHIWPYISGPPLLRHTHAFMSWLNVSPMISCLSNSLVRKSGCPSIVICPLPDLLSKRLNLPDTSLTGAV